MNVRKLRVKENSCGHNTIRSGTRTVVVERRDSFERRSIFKNILTHYFLFFTTRVLNVEHKDVQWNKYFTTLLRPASYFCRRFQHHGVISFLPPGIEIYIIVLCIHIVAKRNIKALKIIYVTFTVPAAFSGVSFAHKLWSNEKIVSIRFDTFCI